MTDWTLAPQAERDLGDLYVYGARTFGRAAAIRYVDDLLDCFGMLAGQPRIGRVVDALHRGARRFERRQHVIYYEERAAGILVLAIVHVRSVRGIDP